MYNISEEDTILGIAELSFDLSVFDMSLWVYWEKEAIDPDFFQRI